MTTPAKVSASYEIKLQPRPDESAGVFLTITWPCYREEVHDRQRWLRKYLASEIEQEKQAIERVREANMRQAMQEPPL